MTRNFLLAGLVCAAGFALHAQSPVPKAAPPKTPPPTAEQEMFMRQSRELFRGGKNKEAIGFATKAIAAAPKNMYGYLFRGQLHETLRMNDEAVQDLSIALQLDPSQAEIYQLRGACQFKLGRFKESIADFDAYIRFQPKQEPHHWQRGISYYYAKRYEEGRKQFDWHQTVNHNDVENAVWHFLCVARKDGLEKAREKLIPIEGDKRVPMMEVLKLFAGTLKPSEVMTAAKAGNPPPAELEYRLFNAHLYLGLYYDVTGKTDLARLYLGRAAEKSEKFGYMGDVARVHADYMQKEPIAAPKVVPKVAPETTPKEKEQGNKAKEPKKK